jgi:hypothetical protein
MSRRSSTSARWPGQPADRRFGKAGGSATRWYRTLRRGCRPHLDRDLTLGTRRASAATWLLSIGLSDLRRSLPIMIAKVPGALCTVPFIMLMAGHRLLQENDRRSLGTEITGSGSTASLYSMSAGKMTRPASA